MSKQNVTSKVTKSAGTDTPEPTPATPRKGRTPVAPEQRTLTIRGAQRRYVALLLDALDGSADAIATLFGDVAPAMPEKPTLADSDKTNPDALLAHIAALDAYSAAVAEYGSALDAWNTRNAARSNIRSAVWNAIHDIPLRKRNGTDASEDASEDTAE